MVDKGDHKVFIVLPGADTPPCPCCGRSLHYRDSRARIRKREGGGKETLIIRRLQCSVCNRLHNELPDCLTPYKHYGTDVISGVLPRFDRAETEEYIISHMDYAGCTQEIFTEKAVDEVYKVSAGIPRMINRICDKTLMYGFQQQKRLIDDHMVQYVAEHEMLIAAT